MAGGLAQAQQGFEHHDLRFRQALGFDRAAAETVAVVLPQLVVELALRRLQFAVDGLLGLGRQFPRDLVLGAPQDKRP